MRKLEETALKYKDLCAILFGAFMVAIIYCSLEGFSLFAFVPVFLLALLHSVLLGLPLYFVLPEKWKRLWVTPVVAGFFIGALLQLLATNWDTTYDGRLNDTYYVKNGVRTIEGWKKLVKPIFFFGFLGTSGAVSTWLAWMYLLPSSNTASKQKDTDQE